MQCRRTLAIPCNPGPLVVVLRPRPNGSRDCVEDWWAHYGISVCCHVRPYSSVPVLRPSSHPSILLLLVLQQAPELLLSPPHHRRCYLLFLLLLPLREARRVVFQIRVLFGGVLFMRVPYYSWDLKEGR